jgi:hypothetical protein
MTLYYFNSSGKLHDGNVLLVHTEDRVEFLTGASYGHYGGFDFDSCEYYEWDEDWIVIHTNR